MLVNELSAFPVSSSMFPRVEEPAKLKDKQNQYQKLYSHLSISFNYAPFQNPRTSY